MKRCLSLFAGTGGSLLGEHLLGWEHAGAVELQDWRRDLLALRFPGMPVLADVREVPAKKDLFGSIDIITAGFPCQPFSVAGKCAGENDPRNGWPWTIDAIRALDPPEVFLENVPGLLKRSAGGYFGRILMDLMAEGYGVRWGVLAAADVGAHHLRKRLWIRGMKGWQPVPTGTLLGKVTDDTLVDARQGFVPVADSFPSFDEESVNKLFADKSIDVFPEYGSAWGGQVWMAPAWAKRTSEGVEMHYTPVKYDATPGGPGNHYHGLGWMSKHHPEASEKAEQTNLDYMLNRLCGDDDSDVCVEELSDKVSDTAKGQNLNPVWVEAYQGFPVGWTDPSASVDLDAWPDFTKQLWATTRNSFTDWPWSPLATTLKDLTDKRISALGDAQVPQCMAEAYRRLSEP